MQFTEVQRANQNVQTADFILPDFSFIDRNKVNIILDCRVQRDKNILQIEANHDESFSCQASPELKAVIAYLRSKNGPKARRGVLNGKRVDYFKGQPSLRSPSNHQLDIDGALISVVVIARGLHRQNGYQEFTFPGLCKDEKGSQGD